MTNSNDSASLDSSGAQPSDRLAATTDRFESRSDPLSHEDIDAQIRWFFDNVVERKSLRP
jgi:hypothetical protein